MAKEKKSGLSIFLRIVLALILIIIIMVGFIFFYVKGKLDKIQTVELPSNEDLGITETVSQDLTGRQRSHLLSPDNVLHRKIFCQNP